MCSQVANICKNASYSLYRISKVRKYIDNTTCERLVHAFISSKLDYCNSLLAGLPNYLIKRLQVIQNSAARLVTGINLRMSIHITPVLRQLHWLPLSQRIDFKILCLIFKCVHWSSAPSYLKDIIYVRKSTGRSLRSNNTITLDIPNVKTLKNYGDRAFSIYGPRAWNKLPSHLRVKITYDSFKVGLKTHLFQKAFRPPD